LRGRLLTQRRKERRGGRLRREEGGGRGKVEEWSFVFIFSLQNLLLNNFNHAFFVTQL